VHPIEVSDLVRYVRASVELSLRQLFYETSDEVDTALLWIVGIAKYIYNTNVTPSRKFLI